MTSLGLLLAAALVAVFAVERAADWLNLRALDPRVPDRFKDVFDAEKYARAQDYARARTRFTVAASSYGLLLLLAFWFGGGFAFLDGLTRGLPPLGAGLAYVGVLLAGNELLTLPLELYSTFVLEQRFGFNRTTPRTFVLDKLKAWALVLLIGGPFLLGVLAFFGHAGPRAWLWAWGLAAAFRVFLLFLAPTLIMPLFNKFTPLPDGELRRSIFDLAGRVGFPLTNIFVMDGSKRSSKTNAFFTGFGRNKRIALFDTLVARHSVPELTAVMAHEIGHYKQGHVFTGLALALAKDGLIFWLLSLFLTAPPLFRAFGVAEPSVHTGLVFFGIVYAPAAFLLSIGLAALSRRHEFEADRYAARHADPDAMAAALKTLSVSNLSNLTPHPFYVLLHHTHPPVLERLAGVERWKAARPA